jgi:hypothetical protein
MTHKNQNSFLEELLIILFMQYLHNFLVRNQRGGAPPTLDARLSALNILFILRRALPYAVGCEAYSLFCFRQG